MVNDGISAIVILVQQSRLPHFIGFHIAVCIGPFNGY